jgi:hypothetical protein
MEERRQKPSGQIWTTRGYKETKYLIWLHQLPSRWHQLYPPAYRPASSMLIFMCADDKGSSPGRWLSHSRQHSHRMRCILRSCSAPGLSVACSSGPIGISKMALPASIRITGRLFRRGIYDASGSAVFKHILSCIDPIKHT